MTKKEVTATQAGTVTLGNDFSVHRLGYSSRNRRELVIGTPERFHCGKQIASYVGLVPAEESSGDRRGLGHISKQGNSLLRFLLVEAAQGHSAQPPTMAQQVLPSGDAAGAKDR